MVPFRHAALQDLSDLQLSRREQVQLSDHWSLWLCNVWHSPHTDSINRMSSTTVHTAVHSEELSKSSARGLKADIFSRSRLWIVNDFFTHTRLNIFKQCSPSCFWHPLVIKAETAAVHQRRVLSRQTTLCVILENPQTYRFKQEEEKVEWLFIIRTSSVSVGFCYLWPCEKPKMLPSSLIKSWSLGWSFYFY